MKVSFKVSYDTSRNINDKLKKFCHLFGTIKTTLKNSRDGIQNRGSLVVDSEYWVLRLEQPNKMK